MAMPHSIYNLVFISTFIDLYTIDQLIKTVRVHNKFVNLCFIIVNQTNNELQLQNTANINFIELKTSKTSLSNARNIGIQYIREQNIEFEHIMFPDDDSTFDEVFFEMYPKVVKKGKCYLMDVYSTGTKKLYRPNTFESNNQLTISDYNSVMSVNMIIDFDTYSKVGYFDENLGVGAKYGAGEDSDYFIRCCKKNGRFIYTKELHNFHPASMNNYRKMSVIKLINRFRNYGQGVIYMQCKHYLYKDAFVLCVRAIGGGIKALLELKFKLAVAYFLSFFTRTYLFIQCLIKKT